MIHRVFSSLPTFKTLHFGQGLNILLSEKCPARPNNRLVIAQERQVSLNWFISSAGKLRY